MSQLDGLQSAVETGDAARMVACCIEEELQRASTASYEAGALHMLGLLLMEDLNSARFLWKRSTEAAKQDNNLVQAWGVARALWQDDAVEAYRVLEETNWTLCQQIPLPPIVAKLLDLLRLRACQRMASSFSCISVAHAGKMLGVDEAEVGPLFSKFYSGWDISDDGLWLTFKATPVSIGARPAALPEPGRREELRKLTSQVLQLQVP